MQEFLSHRFYLIPNIIHNTRIPQNFFSENINKDLIFLHTSLTLSLVIKKGGATLAQSVERHTRNVQVCGSIPQGGS